MYKYIIIYKPALEKRTGVISRRPLENLRFEPIALETPSRRLEKPRAVEH